MLNYLVVVGSAPHFRLTKSVRFRSLFRQGRAGVGARSTPSVRASLLLDVPLFLHALCRSYAPNETLSRALFRALP